MKIQSWAIGLGGLLGVCAVVLLFSKSEQSSFPSARNVGPSGTAALVRLLERDGYKPRISRSPFLPTKPNELIIAPVVFDAGKSIMSALTGETVTPIERAISRHVSQGGSALLLQIPEDFNAGSRDFDLYQVQTPSGVKKVMGPARWASPKMLMPYEAPGKTATPYRPSDPAPLLHAERVNGRGYEDMPVIARIQQMGKGKAVSLDAGHLAINRHLATEENADVVTDLVRMMAKPGSEIVVAEAAFGNGAEESLGSALGNWFTAARNQALLFAIVVCVTLGVRFGRVLPSRQRARGAREMVDALATQLASSRDRVFMLRCFATQIESEMKRLEGLPASSETTALLRVIPGQERDPLAQVLSLPADARVSANDAISYAKDLEAALAAAKVRAKDRSLRSAS